MDKTIEAPVEIDGLFYSTTEKKLFFIPKYYTHGTGMLDNLIENLEEGKAMLRKFVPTGEIYCDEIRKSSRYKSMWYFSIELDKAPAEAFELGEDWSMFKWIEN